MSKTFYSVVSTVWRDLPTTLVDGNPLRYVEVGTRR